MGRKRRVKKMGAVVHLPKKQNNFNMTQWLNSHVGSDVDKMMHGDKIEQEKSLRHFEKETLKARSKLIDDKKRK
jgi:macrodomain Ter protein organizer (MatP/YcbG family)